MSSPSGRRWLLVLVAVLVAATCSTFVYYKDEWGCYLPLIECLETDVQPRLVVRNDRTDPVSVVIDRNGVTSTTVVASRTEQSFYAGKVCDQASLVVRDPQGKELARQSWDGCTTRTWIFTADGGNTIVEGYQRRAS